MLYGRTVSLEKLDLRRHGRHLFEAYSADAQGAIWDYLPYGPFDAQSDLEECYGALSAAGDPLFYAVVPSGSRKPEGVASFLNIVPAHGSIEIGHINFSPTLQNTCAATEALFLMMRHAMDDLGNRRLEWKCNNLNEGSKIAALRLGFTFEGVFRQHMVVKGRNRDSAWFSILNTEWPELRAAFQNWLDPQNFGEDGTQKTRLSSLTKKALDGLKR